jgi:hypothetical protein
MVRMFYQLVSLTEGGHTLNWRHSIYLSIFGYLKLDFENPNRMNNDISYIMILFVSKFDLWKINLYSYYRFVFYPFSYPSKFLIVTFYHFLSDPVSHPSKPQNQINNRSLEATNRTEHRARERLLPRASFFFSLFFFNQQIFPYIIYVYNLPLH